eukprot:s396_g24.t1
MVGNKSNDQDSLLHLPTLRLGEVDTSPDPSAPMPAPPLPEPRQPDLGSAKESEPLGNSRAKFDGPVVGDRPKVLDNIPIVSPQEQNEMTKSKRQKEKDQAAQEAKQLQAKAKAKARRAKGKAKAAAKGKAKKSTKRQTKRARVKAAQKAKVAEAADTMSEEPPAKPARRTRRKVTDTSVAAAATAVPKAAPRKRATKRTKPEETHPGEDATPDSQPASESRTHRRQAKPKASPKKRSSPKKKDTHSRRRVAPEVAARNSLVSSLLANALWTSYTKEERSFQCYTKGFCEKLLELYEGRSGFQPPLRQKLKINPRKSDKEIFSEMELGAPAVEVNDGNYIGGNAVKSLSEAPGGPMRHGSTSSFSENDYDSYWKVQQKKDEKLAKALARDEAQEAENVEMPSPKKNERDSSNVPQPSEVTDVRQGGHHEPQPSARTSPGDTPAPAVPPCPAAPTPAETAGSESEGEDAKSRMGEKGKVKNKFDKYYYKSIGGI